MDTEDPQLTVSRAFDTPRDLVYRAFTDPDQLAAWWGPIGNSLPRDEIEFDVRPGGYQRWTEIRAAEPIEPFTTRFRIEFHDEPDPATAAVHRNGATWES
jgi:uncharacterized protein YndB with AHSA1/START domain